MGTDLLGLLLVLVVVLLVALVLAIYYGVRLWRLWALVHDPEMPDAARYAFYGALIYAICPVDLLPDPIYLDDVGVLLTAITYIIKVARRLGLLDRTPVMTPAVVARPAAPGPVRDLSGSGSGSGAGAGGGPAG